MAGNFWRVRYAYPPYSNGGASLVGWVSEAHPPLASPGHKTIGKVMVLLRLKKNRPIRADFPPGAGIAKGAAASPLCTFA
ncbi:hypothetical protein EYS39_09680 [Cronobacter sakazakii]|nr:hypothetical protein EYS39_09680 [Cronobacter sakazakii]